MPRVDDPLTTPVYLKTQLERAWPTDRVFYMLASNGLFVCRNNEFFQSCVPARNFPRELRDQRSFFQSLYPPVPQSMFEYVVGFFAAVGLLGAEAIVLLVWDRLYRRMRLVVPRQVATVGRTHGGGLYPIGVSYEIPADLRPHLTIIGDIHSHVDASAWASLTDCDDESFQAGLHVVIGRIGCEPPEVVVEAVVDGRRFELPWTEVFAGYRRRRMRIPRAWTRKVEVRVRRGHSTTYDDRPGTGDGAVTHDPSPAATNHDDRQDPTGDGEPGHDRGYPRDESHPDVHPKGPHDNDRNECHPPRR
jgi:hypothetical protein